MLSAMDRTFVKKLAQGGAGEVALGKLAASRAANPRVREFGQQMIDDHSKANSDLQSVGASNGIRVPGGLGPEERRTFNRLSKLRGAAFDRAYVADMVEDHKKDVAEFRRESRVGRHPEVKSFAARTLPVLQHHLMMIQDIARHRM